MIPNPRPGPLLIKGALVQLVEDIVGFAMPNVIPFQYNPEKFSWSVEPWKPQEVDQTQRGAQAPTVQPYDPRQTINLSLELDAAEDLKNVDPTALVYGVADRLAALRKLTYPSQGLFNDLLRSAKTLSEGSSGVLERPTVPVVLLAYGPSRILPVRVTSFSVDEVLHNATLHPLQATVSLGLEVLAPDVFPCRMNETEKLAASAYSYTRLIEDSLAIAAMAKSASRAVGLLPFF
ncbi:hypothetical protein G6O69_01175 [Pseudenhygromyxa sp. WMMC2535]|uniref:hypothetical protein n=1 Tax=Pseudenhygromyxa sp. WMMC2535 TaxID=2712867 RepID=UPI0015549A3A|nr:hypothetical protein [Pseudenhygromyxa sp. WMMC2535]NVB36423.1 hypothetical protein [Pseudenhygromyxa sp. WMMC2535]